MDIRVNGAPLQVEATDLATLVAELEFDEAAVATAVNHAFVRRRDRSATALQAHDEVEILTPRQGG